MVIVALVIWALASTEVPVAVRLPVARLVVVALPVVAFPDTESELVKNCPAAVSLA